MDDVVVLNIVKLLIKIILRKYSKFILIWFLSDVVSIFFDLFMYFYIYIYIRVYIFLLFFVLNYCLIFFLDSLNVFNFRYLNWWVNFYFLVYW